ncbi:MAG: 1-acyl-sn-glycerol-3-phosphate acyltransferase [Planctomycetes bacterium]|nr:1-acyl-sn-glycerol-3-phosphate acyltransferase [Planctomycetota bacterium]
MPRLLRVLLTGVAFLTFTLGGAAVGWFVLPFARAGGRSPAAQRRRNRQVLHGAYRAFVRLAAALGLIDVRAAPPRPPAGAYVLVANHPTLLDVMLLLATYPGLTCLVKASWFRSPFIGPLLRQGGYIAGPDGDEEVDGAPVLERVVAALREGAPVLIFPEGTRSPPGGLRRFKVGALEAARRAGVPVVPVVIACGARTLLKGQRWYQVPEEVIRYAITPLEPIRLQRDDDPRPAARALRARYAERLGVAAEQPMLDTHRPHAVP